jgi:hypothetical protein
MELLTPTQSAEGAPALTDRRETPIGLRRAAHELRLTVHAVESGSGWDEQAWSAWCGQVAACLRKLDSAWVRHAEDNESPGGFFDQLRTEAPQLDPRLRQLHREHESLHRTIRRTIDLVARPADPQEVRRDVDGLLSRLSRHEQRGAEVIHQAYEVDDGGGD